MSVGWPIEVLVVWPFIPSREERHFLEQFWHDKIELQAFLCFRYINVGDNRRIRGKCCPRNTPQCIERPSNESGCYTGPVAIANWSSRHKQECIFIGSLSGSYHHHQRNKKSGICVQNIVDHFRFRLPAQFQNLLTQFHFLWLSFYWSDIFGVVALRWSKSHYTNLAVCKTVCLSWDSRIYHQNQERVEMVSDVVGFALCHSYCCNSLSFTISYGP